MSEATVDRQTIVDAITSTMVVNRWTTGDPADEWSWQGNTVIYVERAADAVIAAIEREHRIVPAALLEQAAELIEAWQDLTKDPTDGHWRRWRDASMRVGGSEALVSALRAAKGDG